jgi:phage protein D
MGLNPVQPAITILANEADITLAIQDRLRSIRFTDSTGMESDTLEIVLADHDPAAPLRIPPKGAELELFLGYDASTRRMGLFACDEIEKSGWPGTMTLRARAAIYEKTPKGKTDLQTQKTRSWPKGTKLGDMVAKIAKEHGMEPAVAKSLKATVLPHLDQTDESDISFLLRVAKTYDAAVKPGGGKLVLAKRGESKSASGEDLPVVLMTADQVTDWRYNESSKEAPGGVIAYWHDTKGARKKEVKVGDDDPTKRLRHHFPTEAAAKAAAQAEYDKRKRGEIKFSGSLPGDPNLMAEGRLVLSGFGAGPDGEWLLTSVTHELSDNGYRCQIEAEKPNESEGE